MAKIELELSQDTLDSLSTIAQQRNASIARVIEETCAGKPPVGISPNSIFGLFADDADIMDEIVNEAMNDRLRPFRVSDANLSA